MDKTIRLVTHDQCTGCGACYNKCPANAIEMKLDSEGFLFPYIHSDKCINCGLCLKACPVAEPQLKNEESPACYAVMADDEIRKGSSSGGVFSLLAEWILKQGGIVCGAAYSQDCYSVKHILVSEKGDLNKLRGSKYVQSFTGLIYQNVKEYLEKGIPVLFTGTPCQVAAIYSYLGKAYDNLFTLDLVCHGVPSPGIYQKFIHEQESIYGGKAVDVKFRDKTIGGWNPSTRICFANGREYRKKRGECAYLVAFLKLLTIRRSCGQCPFAKLPRQGDMTIADFWDIHRYNPQYDDKLGTSLVLVNNPKGRIMQDILAHNSILCKGAPLEHAIKYNAQIKYSSVLNPRRGRFFDLINSYNYTFEKAVDYGLNRRFDIGYVGWWYGANYGSVMTNYALNCVLKKMGKTVLMLEWPVLNGNVPKGKPDNKSRRFAKHFYEQSLMYRLDDYKRFNYHCNAFIVGSDQLWNWWSNRDVGSYYFFLDFVDDRHKKIAYSTSFGHETAYYPQEMRLKVSYLLHRFDAISVREKSGVDICKRDFNVDAVQTVDPVFLCSMDDYDKAIALSNVVLEKEYVLGYILNPTKEKIESIRYVADALALPYYIILDGQEDFQKLKEEANDPQVLDSPEIADWLNYFKHATYVVTDSFHGFCFSILFERNMTVFPNKLRGLARFESLSQMTGLNNRIVYSKKELISKAAWNKPVDFESVKSKMQPHIDFSRQWLSNALEMEKCPPSARELELKCVLQMQNTLLQLQENNRHLQQQMNAYNVQTDNPSPAPVSNTSNWYAHLRQCCADHGLLYTIKYAIVKVWRQMFSR